jgi:exodeoxyribonuclease X
MKVYLIDTETTGTKEPVPVELAILELPGECTLNAMAEPPKVVCNRRYKPGKPIDLGALCTHHIHEKDLVGCSPWSPPPELAEADYLIGHQIDFDWEAVGRPEKPKRICTLALSRYLWPEIDSHKLGAMTYMVWGEDYEEARTRARGAHGALADVNLTHTLLEVILTMLPEVDTWEALWEASEVARIPLKMTFGKHFGEYIKDIPPSYKQWLLRQSDVDPYLRRALAD